MRDLANMKLLDIGERSIGQVRSPNAKLHYTERSKMCFLMIIFMDFIQI